MNNLSIKKLILYFFTFFLFNMLAAQHFLFHDLPKDTAQIDFQFMHPNLKEDIGISTLSGIYDLSLNIPISKRTNFNISLPYIVMSYEYSYTFFNTRYHYHYKENSIGNIYLGVQTTPKDTLKKGSGKTLSFGLFLPTIAEDKFDLFILGIYTDLHQLQKYIPNTLTIWGNIAYHKKELNQLFYGYEVGPNIYLPTKDDGSQTEIYFHYGITGGVQIPNLAFLAELLGIVILTEDIDEFRDRFSHSFILGMQWSTGRIRPGIFYKLYLEEEQSDTISGVLGIKVAALLQ
jgi:hypothetical protein